MFYRTILVILAIVLVSIITFLPAQLRNGLNTDMASTIYKFVTELSFISSSSKVSIIHVAANTELLDNIGHFVVFAFCGVLISRLKHRFSTLALLIALFIVAGGSELSQNFVPGRHPGWDDVLIDFVAGLCGFGVASWNKRRGVTERVA